MALGSPRHSPVSGTIEEIKVPSKSGKQHRYMEMIANGGKPRSGKGRSVAVAKELVAADVGKHFGNAKGKRK